MKVPHRFEGRCATNVAGFAHRSWPHEKSWREIPSLRMVAFNVVLGNPNRFAAALTTPWDSRTTRMI
jgi:hypothetical protein